MTIPSEKVFVVKYKQKKRVIELETLYKISCKINNKFYIGSTSHLNKRIERHLKNAIFDQYEIWYKKCPELYEDIIRYGIDNFEVTIINETNDKIEISRQESKEIRKNSRNPLLYNKTMGASGRRVLSDEDVYFIRELYKNKTIYIKEAYEIYYKDIVTYRAFKKCWHGDTFKDIHYDVYTKENKDWHFAKGQSRPGEKNPKSKYTKEEVISIRKRRDNGEPKEVVKRDFLGRSSSNAFNEIWNNKSWKMLL